MTTAPADPAALSATLSGFAAAITGAETTREGVSVTVTRRGGFQNDALTASGQALLIDEPVHFGGRGEAPDPAEMLLAAIGASLSVTLTAHAALRGLAIDHIALQLAAEIDGVAFFHPGRGVPGLLDVAIILTVTTPAKRSDVRSLLRDVLRATPVLCSLKRRPKVTLVFKGKR